MSNSGALHVCRDFFGADEAITNYVPGREEWVATLIISGKDRKHAWEKRDRVIKEIQEKYHLIRYIDSSPDQIELKP
jgi:pyrrolysine biosynthesis protein PylC